MTADRDEFVRRQRALADFGEFALRCEDLQKILDEGCRLVAAALGADLAKILEIERDRDTALVRAGVGWRPGIVGQTRIALRDRSSESYALQRCEPVMTSDIAKEDRFDFPEFMRDHGVVAIVNVPVVLPGGVAFGLLEVDSRQPREFGEEDVEFLRTYCTVLGPVIDRLHKVGELERNAERYRLIVQNLREYAIILSDPDDVITDWLPGAAAILGWSEEEMIGRPVGTIFTPEDQSRGAPEHEIETARTTGASADVRWHRTKNGGRVFLDGQTIAMRNTDGTMRGFLKIGQDVTERKRDDERRTILLAELQHRVRNVLAMVASVVKRADVAGTTEEFRERLSGRIAAMARTQALLTRGAGVGVDLEGILRDELSAQMADESRTDVAGPAILLAPKAAEVLTLAIHELATNAIKYGGLQQPGGRVDVTWSLNPRDGQDWLELDWRESGYAVEPRPNRRKGFGTELITRRVPYELEGEGEVNLQADGLDCRIAFPLTPGSSTLQTDIPAAARPEATPDMAHETALAGYSVLVVEDDFYLADDLRQTLEDAGATVLGPARNAADALRVTGQTRPDGAVVDVNLGTGPTFEIPRALRGLGVPFILATGYDASVISPEFADAPRLEKPVDPRRLVAAVAELRQAAKA